MVDYEFYLTVYRGNSISMDEWAAVEREASATLARYKRIYKVTAPPDSFDAESMAVCAMADVMMYHAKQEAGQGAIASTSVGSVSTSYASVSVDMSQTAKSRRVYNACALYLNIYRGCG